MILVLLEVRLSIITAARIECSPETMRLDLRKVFCRSIKKRHIYPLQNIWRNMNDIGKLLFSLHLEMDILYVLFPRYNITVKSSYYQNLTQRNEFHTFQIYGNFLDLPH